MLVVAKDLIGCPWIEYGPRRAGGEVAADQTSKLALLESAESEGVLYGGGSASGRGGRLHELLAVALPFAGEEEGIRTGQTSGRRAAFTSAFPNSAAMT